jgi:outer membrane protein assembly factor BamB
MRLRVIPAALAAAAVTAACGSSGGERHAAATRTATPPATPPPAAAHAAAGPAARDWTRFGFDAARTSAVPRGISVRAVRGLAARTVALPGTVDASPILLAGVRAGGKQRDLLVMTTTYGRTVALDAASGRTVWRFQPAGYAAVAGTAQITTATPLARGGTVYAASPDGRIHRLRAADGHEVTRGGWPVSVTKDATHEKIASALNSAGGKLLVTTGGYIGDAPPYQGKVVAIDAGSGRITAVFNSLCANRRAIIRPSACPASASAIWGRAGAVVDPRTGHVLATSSNGPFDGRVNWGDSVLELSAGVERLLRHYTPREQAQLESQDIDLGSTSPALLPDPRTGTARFVLQGGKDGRLRLLALPGSLSGVTGAAGRRLGGEAQIVTAPGATDVFTAIAVLHRAGRTEAFVATNAGTAAFRFDGRRLHRDWSTGTPGTSPLVAGGVLWVYDQQGGHLVAYRPLTGRVIHRFAVPTGHWNSPIVAGGRVYLPTGNANDRRTSGSLTILGPR